MRKPFNYLILRVSVMGFFDYSDNNNNNMVLLSKHLDNTCILMWILIRMEKYGLLLIMVTILQLAFLLLDGIHYVQNSENNIIYCTYRECKFIYWLDHTLVPK